jgi:hypothetical protein
VYNPPETVEKFLGIWLINPAGSGQARNAHPVSAVLPGNFIGEPIEY